MEQDKEHYLCGDLGGLGVVDGGQGGGVEVLNEHQSRVPSQRHLGEEDNHVMSGWVM